MGRPFQEQMEFETAIVTSKQTASSGVFTGGVLSINADNTKYDVSAGEGVYINTSNPNNPVSERVTWAAMIGQTPSFAANGATYIALNSSGNLINSSSPPDNDDYRNRIILGTVYTQNGVNINAVTDTSSKPSTYLGSDIARALGNLNLSGNTFVNAATDLTIRKEAGTSFNENSNRAVSPLDPSVKNNPVIASATFCYIYSDGGGGVTTVAAQTNIDPNQYDDGTGVLAAVPSNKYTNQYIYFNPLSQEIFVQYGEDIFNSMGEAQLAAFNSPTLLAPEFSGTLIRSILSVKKSTTDLSQISDAFFSQTGKFGIGISGGGSGATGLQDLQDVYDNSSNPEIITDATRSAVTFRRGSAADTDNVTEVQNGAGTITSYINGNGNGLFTNLLTVNSATNAFMTLNADSSSSHRIDRGSSSYYSGIENITGGVTGWFSGIDSSPAALNTGYSIKRAVGGATVDFCISSTTGNIGMGVPYNANKSLLVRRTSGLATIEVNNIGLGAVTDISSLSSSGIALMTITRGGTAYDGSIRWVDFPATVNWVIGNVATPAAQASAFVIKTNSTGNPEFIISKAGNIGIGSGAALPTSRLQVVGGGILSGAPTGGDKGAGTINTEKGVFTNGANGSHRGVRTTSVSTSWAIDDNIIIVDAAALTGNITLTISTAIFQDAFNTTGGRVISVVVNGSSGANTITVDTEGSQTVYGGSSFLLTTDQSTTLLCTNPGGTSGQGTFYILARYTD